MKRFVVTLSEEHRAKLETIRRTQGLRSEAEAVRYLIDFRSRITTTADLKKLPAGEAVHTWPQTPDVASARVDVPKLERKAFNPQPKKGAKK